MSRVINLVGTTATLLSGGLRDCYNVNDTSCEGGIAAVNAYVRNLTKPKKQPTLIVPAMDKQSQFVQIHPMGWNVNRLILSDHFGMDLFTSTPSLLIQNSEDYEVSRHDISHLQTHDMPLLLTNADIPPSISWHQYVESVHFDETTKIALLFIGSVGVPLSWPQIDSAKGMLNYIRDINVELGCDSTKKIFSLCWIPVIYYHDYDPVPFSAFIEAMSNHNNPPAAIIDLERNSGNYSEPKQIFGSTNIAGDNHNNGVWVHSFNMRSDTYYQHQFILSKDLQRIDRVEFITKDLETLPAEIKDKTYANDILFLRQLADEAQANNPVVGLSTAMPVARNGLYRRCKGGECEIGNLFADAIRWHTDSDIAFVTSGGLRGSGWDAGEVHVSNIWEALPFPNTLCTGVMSGLSLFKLLDYSMGIATFESETTNDGGRLLQISGMKVAYNTEIEGSRVISIDIWDKDALAYLPIDRLRLYKFGSDSYVCGAYDPFPELLGANGNFVVDGEQPALINDDLLQNAVGDFLGQLQKPYNATIQGRLVNNTNAIEPLDLIQTEKSCFVGSYWVEEKLTCFACPNSSHVFFSDKRIEFVTTQGSSEQQTGRALLVNREVFNFTVSLRSVPSWMKFISSSQDDSSVNGTDIEAGGRPMILQPGDSIAFDFIVGNEFSEVGTALGTVSFAIFDGGNFPGCVYKRDATFDVLMRTTPSLQLNQLGPIRSVGMSLSAIAILTSIAFSAWVLVHKNFVIIKTMQPHFLVTICLGVMIWSSAIIPLSIDDELVSIRGCNVSCLAMPWLLTVGATITFSALFSKLWRINKLFNASSFHKVVVTEKDVLGPFAVLFAVNFCLLLAWSLIDPWKWKRLHVNGEEWNTYGVCQSDGQSGSIFIGLAIVVNIGALLLAIQQAYKARSISSQFSESKLLFIAIYTWLQLMLVGLPVLMLIKSDNVTASYFLKIGLIFICSMSMVLVLFVPIVRHIFMKSRPETQSMITSNKLKTGVGGGTTHVSGLNSNSQFADYRGLSNYRSDVSASNDPLNIDNGLSKSQLDGSFQSNVAATQILNNPYLGLQSATNLAMEASGPAPSGLSPILDLNDLEAPSQD